MGCIEINACRLDVCAVISVIVQESAFLHRCIHNNTSLLLLFLFIAMLCALKLFCSRSTCPLKLIHMSCVPGTVIVYKPVHIRFYLHYLSKSKL